MTKLLSIDTFSTDKVVVIVELNESTTKMLNRFVGDFNAAYLRSAELVSMHFVDSSKSMYYSGLCMDDEAKTYFENLSTIEFVSRVPKLPTLPVSEKGVRVRYDGDEGVVIHFTARTLEGDFISSFPFPPTYLDVGIQDRIPVRQIGT